ncbi:MAG TPA: RidA family protein, partial [Hymenobacter sp.]
MNPTYGPYSPFRRAGNLIFISGQIGVNPDTKNASVEISEQTAQALINMETVLQAAGASMKD